MRAAGVSEAVIGLTLVALGTSLPELATAVIASYKKHTDVLIGNVLGSNLFNILSILGITAIVAPIPFAGRIADIDVWIMLAIAVFLFGVIFVRGRISRVLPAAVAEDSWQELTAVIRETMRPPRMFGPADSLLSTRIPSTW